jgi:hypothetical protein
MFQETLAHFSKALRNIFLSVAKMEMFCLEQSSWSFDPAEAHHKIWSFHYGPKITT